MNLNKVFLIGRITKDVDLRQTPSGQAVASTSLATNRSYKDKSGNKVEQSEFHNLVFWGKTAELVSQYCKKGSELFVTGRLQTRNYEDKSGTKRYITEIQVEEMQFGAKPQNKETGVAQKRSEEEYPEMDFLNGNAEDIL